MDEAVDRESSDRPMDVTAAWLDPHLRVQREYFLDGQGNSASREVLLSERATEWRERLANAQAEPDPSPADFARVRRLRLLIAATMLEEFADRLQGVPGGDSFAELARELAEDFWETPPIQHE